MKSASESGFPVKTKASSLPEGYAHRSQLCDDLPFVAPRLSEGEVCADLHPNSAHVIL
jgi:hypothetical protein